MAIEIERRFLVLGNEWEQFVIDEQEIQQGYLSLNFQEWITRVRIVNGKQAWITLKKSKDGFLNQEFELQLKVKQQV